MKINHILSSSERKCTFVVVAVFLDSSDEEVLMFSLKVSPGGANQKKKRHGCRKYLKKE